MPSKKFQESRRENDSSLFNTHHYLVLRRAIDELPLIEKLAIEMRFFHHFSISEIARYLRIGWSDADALIEASLEILRRSFASDPHFFELITEDWHLAKTA